METQALRDHVSKETQVAIDAIRDHVDARHAEVLAAIKDLREYVEKIEKEANDMMGAMNDPDAMMKMAGKFLGGGF